MAYTVNDKRGKKAPQEVCRVCGAPTVHSKDYNKPTMECIKYLRAELAKKESPVSVGMAP